MQAGSPGMFPFQRFSDQAKRLLTLAQEEAERGGQSYIGTEHMLLGMVRDDEGLAGRILQRLGVEERVVRQAIKAVLGRNERVPVQQIVPTPRVKRVIEIAFEEARRRGDRHVGTEHLLLGLLVEGQGIAARALGDLHVTPERVEAGIRQLRAGGRSETLSGVGPEPAPPPGERGSEVPTLTPDATDLLRYAQTLAVAGGSGAVGLDHLRRALDDPAVQRLLELGARIRQAVAAREQAMTGQNWQAAHEHRLEEARLRQELATAEAAWVATLRRPDTGPGQGS